MFSSFFTRKVYFSFLLAVFSISAFGQLNGTYTIGGTSPNYSTINAAVTALVGGGVTGPVVFNIRSGVYSEQLTIGSISGVSSTNTVTFQSQSADSTAVTITYTPSSTDNYTLRFNGCDYVIFKKLSIRATGTSYSTVVKFETGSTFNRFENNIIEGPSVSTSSTNNAVVYGSTTSINNNSFINNAIKNGSYGIYLSASSSSVQLNQNTFTNQYYHPIDLTNLSNLIVSKNTISSNSTYSSFEAIYLSSCGSGLAVTGNKINMYYGQAAIDLYSCTATSSTRGLIANNFIYLAPVSASSYGIYSYNSTYQNIYFNSINNTRASSSAYALYFSGSSSNNLQLQSNILSCNGGGYPVYTDYTSIINVSDYNDFYTTGSYIGNWAGTYCTTLASWRSSSSQDVHSVNIMPEFTTPSNLHIETYLLSNLGYPASGVTDDIDGQARSFSTPDIGADEWTVPANDAGITSIDQNLTYCITNDSVFAYIKNFGSSSLTSATVNWTVNGVSQTPKSWTGSLAQGNTAGPFCLGYYNFNLGTAYSVYVWTTSPNGGTEGFTHNDSTNVLNKYKAMSGTYTIGGTSPDYTTFNAAVTDLTNGGVCGPVIFNVRNGIYNEQFSISQVNGVSSTNSIIFQSQSGDSTAVTITYAPISTNNYTVRLNGSDYVTFRKMKIIATGTTYATVFRIESGSIYNTIDRCLIYGSNTTTSSANLVDIYCSGSTVNNNSITQNKIYDGSYGIYYSASSASVIISQNVFTNQYYQAINLASLSQLTVSRNTISSNTSYSSFEAISLNSCGTSLVVSANKINLINGQMAIDMTSCTASNTTRGLISNNFISLSSNSSSGYGIYSYNCTYQNFYYNSINNNRSTSSSYGFYCSGSSGNNIQLQNNIFSCPGSGYCVYTDYSSLINLSDYNDFYTTGSYIGNWAGTYCPTLANWRSSSSLDVHSVNIMPEFTSPSNLHVETYQLDNLGYPASGVTTDIDGQSRSFSTPDMGADEWTMPANDAGVTAIDQNLTYCIVNDSVFAYIKNFGSSSLTSVTVNWMVNSSIQTPKSWTGSLAQGNTAGPFSLGYYNFNLGSAYSVTAWTTQPNGAAEGFTHNDSTFVGSKYKAMSGTYTIGGTSPDYATISAAATDLVNGGVCGPVVFNIRNGIYNEQVSIGQINGVSATNNVLFQSQSGDSTAVTITYAPISSNNYTVRLNGCDYVTFKKMKIIATGTTYATVLRIESGSVYITIDRCLIYGANTTSASTNLADIYCSGASVNNNSFTQNKITDGSYAIYFSGSSANINISLNTFTNQYYQSINLYSMSVVNISKNTITSNTTNSGFEAIYLSSCGSNLVLSLNKISLNNGQTAIDMSSCTASSSTRGVISNNFITLSGNSSIGYGIYCYNCSYQNFFYNSINNNRSTSSSYGFFCSGSSSSNIQLQNNIISCPGGGFCLYTDYTATINLSDYNDLYSTGSYVGYWAGNYCPTLANWRSTSSLDVHSVSILPEFTSPSNLHVESYLLDNLGYPVSGVTTDIDGQSRSFSTPDIGADEWTTPANDAGVTSIDQNLTYCISNDSVFAYIKNFGSSTLTSVTVNWLVNGSTQTPKSWTGSLAQGNTAGPFSLGYYNFNLGTAYSVTAWTTSPNGGTEGFTHNDSTFVGSKYKAMSGTYTIGGTSPDYATFAAALTDLNNGGICGPVVFNVRNGIYNEQPSISQINGSSATNNVVFKSETGDSTAVIISFASSSSGANYTFRLNSCDYITIRKMKIVATGTTYGTAIRIESGSTYNVIDRCLIYGANTTSTSSNLADIYCATSSVNNNSFTQNKITDGSYGIYYSGSSANINISQNNFINQYYHAIDLYSMSSAAISKNTITSNTTYSGFEAIYLSSSGSSLVVTSNKINIINGQMAIDMTSCTATSSTRGVISNNFITLSGNSSIGYGIYCYNSNYQNFYYNSINNSRTTSSSYAFYCSGSSGNNLQLQNNIISSSGGGFCIYSDYNSTINQSDYNDFYSNGSYIGYWAGTYCPTLANWRSSTLMDVHSVNILPEFTSPSNLHIETYQLDNLGYPVSGVITDIDGQSRSLSTPDIGADEWTTPANDAGIISIDQNLTYCISNDSVFAYIKNYGTSYLTSATINWLVNGTTQTPKSWTGSIAQGNTAGPFSLGYYNFNLGTAYAVTAWTSLPNGSPEGFTHNDSAFVSSKYKAMSGTYTIGGTSPDYATFTAAITDLVNGGVCGPVIFNVRNGIYNEQPSIGQINGSSATNSIIFQSETGDSTAVGISFSSSTTANNYTLRLYGCDYVTFRKMKLIASGSTYAIAVRIESNSLNNTFDRCLIQGWNTTSSSSNAAVIYNSGGPINNCIFVNNKITDGSYGLYLYGNSSGVQIIGNTLTNQYYRGMDLNMITSMTVSKNTISSNTTYTSAEGVYLYACGTSLVFTKNKISVISGYAGIEMSQCTASGISRGLLANNFISVGSGSSTGYGIYSYNNTYLDYFYNSINITRTITSSQAFYVGGTSTSNLQIQNNVFSNSGGGYVTYIAYTSGINSCDYNDLYSTGTYIGYWGSTNCTSLTTWRSTSSLDAHSVTSLPGFFSNTDLHLCNTVLNSAALPISGITEDIDGQSRSVVTPDIGADEFGSVLTVNLGPDLTTCSTVVLNSGIPNSRYLWSSGDTLQTLTVSTPGTYWVRVTNACGSGSDTIIIKNTPPVPGTIYGADSICQSVSGNVYTIGSVSGAATYLWTVPTGWTITAGQGSTSITATSSNTSGNICVSSGSGCAYSLTSCKTISIKLNITAPISIIGDTLVCANDTNLVYSTPPVSGAISYNWTVPTGWSISGGQGTHTINVHSGTTAGNICVSAIGTCNSSSPFCRAIGITGMIATPGSINGLKSVCANQAAINYFITPVTGAKSYLWTVPAGWTIVSGQSTISISVNAGTVGGDICVKALNSCSSSSTSCATISLMPLPVKPDSISGPVGLCSGQGGIKYTISAASGATSYTWTVPSGWTITSGQGTTQITLNAGSTGGNICVSSVNSCGSSISKCLAVSILGTPAKPSSITGPTVSCPGQSGLIYSVPLVSNASSYTWTVPAGWSVFSGQGSNIINVTAGNTGGNICVTATNSCATSPSECFAVSINNAPAKPVSIIGDNSVCEGENNLIYSVLPVSGASSYVWALPSGWNLVSGQGTDSISAIASANSGNITVIAQNLCGSSPQTNTTILVYPLPAKPVITLNGKILSSSSISGNQWYYEGTLIPSATGKTYTADKTGWYTVEVKDGNNCSSISAPFYFQLTGIPSTENPVSMLIYPNPAKSRIFINFENHFPGRAEIQIFDLPGKAVFYSDPFVDKKGSLELQLSLAPGIYLLRAKINDQMISRQLIIE